jgi:hypothetical protein
MPNSLTRYRNEWAMMKANPHPALKVFKATEWFLPRFYPKVYPKFFKDKQPKIL